jgi:hypothetical protein
VLTPVLLGATVVAVLQALTIVLGLGVLLAPVVALVAFTYWRMMRPDERGPEGHRAVVIITLAGTIVGTAAVAIVGVAEASGWAWAAVPLATAVSSAMFSLAFSGGAATCQLCRQPAPSRAGFVCPRCQDRVCARPTCWNAKYVRCVRCHEREIVILPVMESWWKQRLGARLKNGECSHCYKEAHEADLRECGQCRWPMCQRCWDYHNGVCQRCKWVIPDLPSALAAYVAGAAAPRDRGGSRAAAPPPRVQPSPPRPNGRGGAPPGRQEAAAGAVPNRPRRPGPDSR